MTKLQLERNSGLSVKGHLGVQLQKIDQSAIEAQLLILLERNLECNSKKKNDRIAIRAQLLIVTGAQLGVQLQKLDQIAIRAQLLILLNCQYSDSKSFQLFYKSIH